LREKEPRRRETRENERKPEKERETREKEKTRDEWQTWEMRKKVKNLFVCYSYEHSILRKPMKRKKTHKETYYMKTACLWERKLYISETKTHEENERETEWEKEKTELYSLIYQNTRNEWVESPQSNDAIHWKQKEKTRRTERRDEREPKWESRTQNERDKQPREMKMKRVLRERERAEKMTREMKWNLVWMNRKCTREKTWKRMKTRNERPPWKK